MQYKTIRTKKINGCNVIMPGTVWKWGPLFSVHSSKTLTRKK